MTFLAHCQRAQTVALLILVPQALLSDSVLMRNGEILKGTIVNQSSESIVLQNDDEVRVIQKAQIVRVLYDHPLRDSRDEEAERISEQEARIEDARKEAELRKKEEQANRKLKEAVDRIAQKSSEDTVRNNRNHDSTSSQVGLPADKEPSPVHETRPSPQKQDRSDTRAQQDPDPNPTKPTGIDWDAVWKSALVPGAGQYLRGERWKGLGFSMAISAGGFAIYENNRRYRQAKSDLANTGNPFAPSYLILDTLRLSPLPTVSQLSDPLYLYNYSEPYRSFQHSANRHYSYMQNAGWFIGLVYLWNLFDAARAPNSSMQSHSTNTGPTLAPLFLAGPSDARRYASDHFQANTFQGLTVQWRF